MNNTIASILDSFYNNNWYGFQKFVCYAPGKEEIMQQQNENKFSFINEKIKEKPINKRKLVIQSAFTVGDVLSG